jgi:uncharacterized protein (TIGR02145 family)
MKANKGWHNARSGTNESGFSGLPGGIRSLQSFAHVGEYGYFWSTTEYRDEVADCAWILGLGDLEDLDTEMITYDLDMEMITYKEDGLSVRCLRD